MPMLASPYGAAAAKLNCLSPPLPTIGATPSSRKSFHPWKKMTDGHYPFAYAPHYPTMTSSLTGSREMTSERGVGVGDGSGGGFAMHGYSHRGSGMSSSSCAMAPACVLPPGAGPTAAVPTGIFMAERAIIFLPCCFYLLRYFNHSSSISRLKLCHHILTGQFIQVVIML